MHWDIFLNVHLVQFIDSAHSGDTKNLNRNKTWSKETNSLNDRIVLNIVY